MRVYFLTILFFLIQSVFSQTFETKIDQRKVGLHESFEVSFVLDDSGKNFSPPPFSDFQILRGPSKSSSTSIFNGNFTQETSYTYVLKPKKIGVFTILPASIKVNGKTIGTNPITIQVVKGDVPKKPNTPHSIVSRKVHLEVYADKKTVYVGEPIVLTYTLYFNLNIGSLSTNSIEYSNFWVNNLEVNGETKKRTYKGESYNYAVVKQVVLTPQTSGEHTIEQLSIDLVASIPSGRRDFFNMVTNKNVDYTVVSNSLKIEVLDLPKKGKPNNFSGAIGDFNLSVDLDKDSININESAIFSVKISGRGNLNLINSPKINFDTQLEVFEPKNVDKIRINKKGVQGYKKEEYLIVPRYKGVYNLNPVNFIFFNPETEKYILLSSEEKRIKVGGVQKSDDSYSLKKINKETIDLINEDIKFIKTTHSPLFIKKNFSSSILFYLLIFIALSVLVIAVLSKKQYIDFTLFLNKTVLKEILEKLDDVNKLLKAKKYKEFQSKLLSILFLYVSKKFSIKKANLSIDNIRSVLNKNNISENTISDYLELIEYLERCKYSLHEGEINKDLYTRAVDLINKINTEQ